MTAERPETSLPSVISFAAVLAVIVLIGWLLYIGQDVLIPILLGVLFLTIVSATAKALGRLPGLTQLSARLHRGLALIAILLLLVALVFFVVENTQGLLARLPEYGESFTTLVNSFSGVFGFDLPADWLDRLRTRVSEFDFSGILRGAVSSFSSVGGVLVTAVLYLIFLMADIDDMPNKTRHAFADEGQAARAMEMADEINTRVGDYLAAKSLVNLILAVFSYAVMWAIGIEFAAFWAILIGVLNFIPYIGSVIGVVFPVALAAVQFGTIWQMVLALVALMAAQTYVGYVLEPRMLGKSVNMSAFMVLVSLAFWSALWGSVGAILAVPLTSVVMIVMAQFPGARPYAVMMSQDGRLL